MMAENKNVETTKIREDLNDMVKDISFTKVKTRYNERKVVLVTLFNDEVIEFRDTENIYDLFMAYRKTGHGNGNDFIKSKKLVEESKVGSLDLLDGQVDEKTGTYVCVLFELEDGYKCRFFPSDRYTGRRMIDIYYTSFKDQQKQNKVTVKSN